jgi:uncharacterized protein involved in exopolysaccharide biosynthesis
MTPRPLFEARPSLPEELTPVPVAASQSGEWKTSPFHVFTMLLRHPVAVTVVPILTVLVVVAWTLLLPRVFTAQATFMPQTSSNRGSALSGLAAQFGFALPGITGEQTSAFYADLLQSGEILRTVVDSPLTVKRDGRMIRTTLVELLDVQGSSVADKRERAIKKLHDHMRVTRGRETGVIKFSVTTRWPDVSQEVADRLLNLVNKFNLESRHSQAGAERTFVEARLAQVRIELRDAEERLLQFRQTNREFRLSSELAVQEQRLQRDLAMRQEIYSTLAQSYEQARIEEVRDTPLITIVERPIVPPRADSRSVVLKAGLALLLGLLGGGAVAFLLEALVETRRQHPLEYEQFAMERARFFTRLRSIRRASSH